MQNQVAVYRAPGGGREIPARQDFIRAALQQRMRQRTDWGRLIPPAILPAELPEPPPCGKAHRLFCPPDW